MLADLQTVDVVTQNKVAARQSELTRPPGSLGKLDVFDHAMLRI